MANTTVIGALSLVPTMRCISVYSPFTGDDNANNSTLLEFQPQGLGRWLLGHPLTVDRRAQLVNVQLSRSSAAVTIANPWTKQWRGSIVGLTPGTTYNVRVTYTDPDGGSGVVQGSVTTLSETIPVGSQVAMVATNGSDASGTGSLANPYATIPYAVSKGDRVLARGGTYPGGLSISKAGLATAYLSIEGYQDEPVVISGGSIGAALKANYLQLKKVRVTAVTGYGVQVSGAYHHLVLDGVKVDTRWLSFIGSGGSALGVPSGPSDVIIRNCLITDPGGSVIEYSGMHLMDTGGRFIIYNNQFLSLGQMKDGIGGTDNDDIYDGCHRDSDIHNNIITGTGDDAIESEGGQMNIREWGNSLAGSAFSAIGHAAVSLGPVYDFRNLIVNVQNAAWKTGGGNYYTPSEAVVFLYHNTIYIALPVVTDGIAGFGNTRFFSNWKVLNNIFHVSKYYAEYLQTLVGHILDYNSIYSESPSAGADHFCAKIGGSTTTTYTSLATYKSATGYDAHSIAALSQFKNIASGDFSLLPTSPEIDKGVLIPNFNDLDSAWPYSGLAPDMGAYEYSGATPPPSGFSPGSTHTSQATVTVKPSGLACQAELYLGPNASTKSATSGVKTFTSTGASQVLSLPVVMPAAGVYHVYIAISAGGISLGTFQSSTDVTVA